MPMPHRTQMQLIKRRLVGKDGSDKVRELRAILAELPGYKNGPYADVRKWVESQLEHPRGPERVGDRAPGTDRRDEERRGGRRRAARGVPGASGRRGQRPRRRQRRTSARGDLAADRADARLSTRWRASDRAPPARNGVGRRGLDPS